MEVVSSPSDADGTINAITAEGTVVTIHPSVIKCSGTLKHLIDCVGENQTIPLSNVTTTTFARVTEHCVSIVEHGCCCADFGVDANNNADLFDLIMAADYMDIQPLLNVTCSRVADMIRGKSAEEIRVVLGIKNDFTPEEEAEIIRQNQWAFVQ